MQFSINSNTLKKVIRKLDSLTFGILSSPERLGVLIEVFENKLVFSTNSEFLDVKFEFSAEEMQSSIQKIGSILIKIKILNEILGKTENNETIDFFLIESSLLQINFKNTKYEVNLLDKNNFEEKIFFIKEIHALEMNYQKLNDLFLPCLSTCDEKNSRKILQGINIVKKNNEIFVISTDSTRITLTSEISVEGNEQEFSIIIHSKVIREIIKLIEIDDKFWLIFDDSNIILKTKNLKLRSKLIIGTFPNTNELFPKEFKNNLELSKNELNTMLEKIILFNNLNVMNIYSMAKLIKNLDILVLETKNHEQGYVSVKTINFNWKGENVFSISFNPKFLLDAIKSSTSTKISVFFNLSNSPFLVIGKNNNTVVKTLILPFRTE